MPLVTQRQLDLDFPKKFEPTPVKRAKTLRLWEGSIQQCAANGQRFSKTVKRKTNGAGIMFEVVPKREDEITDDERKFWVMNDKSWAWHCWLVGCSIDHILDKVGGTREEFTEWMLAVCRGDKRCIYSGCWEASRWPWTDRQIKMLRYMKKHRTEWHTACRLLGRSPHEVKAKLKELSNG